MSITRDELERYIADYASECMTPKKGEKLAGRVMKKIDKEIKKFKAKQKNKDEPRYTLSNVIKEKVNKKIGEFYKELIDTGLFTERKAKTLAVVLASKPLINMGNKVTDDFGLPRVPIYIFTDIFKEQVYENADGKFTKINVCRNTFSKYFTKVWLDKEDKNNQDNEQQIISNKKVYIMNTASSWFKNDKNI